MTKEGNNPATTPKKTNNKDSITQSVQGITENDKYHDFLDYVEVYEDENMESMIIDIILSAIDCVCHKYRHFLEVEEND